MEMAKGLMKMGSGPYEEFRLTFFFFCIYLNPLSMHMCLRGQSWGSSIVLSQETGPEKSSRKSSEIYTTGCGFLSLPEEFLPEGPLPKDGCLWRTISIG